MLESGSRAARADYEGYWSVQIRFPPQAPLRTVSAVFVRFHKRSLTLQLYHYSKVNTTLKMIEFLLYNTYLAFATPCAKAAKSGNSES